MLLDIEADSPVVMVPRSSTSFDMLVIDLGHLKATNKFQSAGTMGTIRGESVPTQTPSAVPTQSMKGDEKQDLASFCLVGVEDLASSYGVSQAMTGSLKSPEAEKECLSWQAARFTGPCLLDCIELSLSDMDVFTAKRESGRDQVRMPKLLTMGRNRGAMLADKCKLNLRIERNLCNDLSKAGTICNVLYLVVSKIESILWIPYMVFWYHKTRNSCEQMLCQMSRKVTLCQMWV